MRQQDACLDLISVFTLLHEVSLPEGLSLLKAMMQPYELTLQIFITERIFGEQHLEHKLLSSILLARASGVNL